jgi:hypothetical protein
LGWSIYRSQRPLKECLLDTLPGLNYRKITEIAQLTPSRGAAARI